MTLHLCGIHQKPSDSSVVLDVFRNAVINSAHQDFIFDATAAVAQRPVLIPRPKPVHLPTIRSSTPSTPIRPMPAIMLPKRQQPTRPLPRTRHLIVVLCRLRRHRRRITGTAVQLRKRHRPRRHRVRRIPPPRRGRGFGQVEENLAVHVALFVARHGLWPVFGQFLHFDVVGAEGALVLGWDGGVEGVEEVDAVEGAVGEEGCQMLVFALSGTTGTYTIVHVTPKLARACIQKPLFGGVA